MGFDTSLTTVIHAGPLVQVRAYGCRTACRRQPLEKCCAWHSIAFMRRGRFERTHRGRRGLVDRSNACLINRRDPYVVQHPDERGDAVTELELRPNVLSAMADAAGAADDPERFPFDRPVLPVRADVWRLHLEIWRAAEHARRAAGVRRTIGRGDDLGLAIEEAAITIAGAVLHELADRQRFERTGRGPRRAGGSRTQAAHRELVHRTTDLLAKRYHEPLDLATIARAVHTSPHHLCRVFRRETGRTIHDHRQCLRLRAGLERIVRGTESLAGLAIDLGFSGQSHFTTAFRRCFGCTPARARGEADLARLRELSTILKDA
ncbi:MAG: helix-turn-helix transcriptional regulator [Phycisphaerales bacterium]